VLEPEPAERQRQEREHPDHRDRHREPIAHGQERSETRTQHARDAVVRRRRRGVRAGDEDQRVDEQRRTDVAGQGRSPPRRCAEAVDHERRDGRREPDLHERERRLRRQRARQQ
jgi:hypothetical protein